MTYNDILEGKRLTVIPAGFDARIEPGLLFPWQVETVRWACLLGRAALFADTGLGKTPMQLAWADAVARHTGGRVLILAPLAVGAQTCREASKFEFAGVAQASCQADVVGPITVANYERLHLFDLGSFSGVVLDESSILKNYTGKTKQALLDGFAETPYRLACTATPAPNDHLELGNHSEFLGVMDSHRMIARWFIADQNQAGSYRLKGHAVGPYWDWVTSWARCIGRPSDMGDYSDEGYDLPALHVHRHSVDVDLTFERGGHLMRMPDLSATGMHKERRRTAADRARFTADLVLAEPGEAWVVWVDTDYDADAVLALLPDAIDVRGGQSPEEKSARLWRFTEHGGVIVTKPGIAGMGLNWQHCARIVFNGIGYSYERFYQATRRCWRFGQSRPVECHVVMAVTELATWSVIDRKADEHEVMKTAMFAASRRAVGRAHGRDPYNPDHFAPLPAWLMSGDAKCPTPL